MPTLTRREFAKLLALSLAGTAAAGAAGLPALGGRALAAPAGTPAPGRLNPDLPLHPLLQYGAMVEPDKVVRVIVQKVKAEQDGRKLAADHGATHLEEFAFVKAHHLEVAQGKLPKLALHPHVLYISPDGPAQKHAIATTALKTTYPLVTNAAKVWNNTNPTSAATGKGITVAVLDTGINVTGDWYASSVKGINLNASATGIADKHGHGTHVASMINGRDRLGNYIGTAPDANLLSVKIADDTGMAHEADMLRGLQWCFNNRAGYLGSTPIRAVNLSICSGVAQSYKTSPVSAAVEQLWFAGVVVVVAAGNRGAAADATWYPPANDPYVITVGALDDNATADNYADDTLAPFSSRGTTQDGLYKPEVVAPGRRIYGALASTNCPLATQMPTHVAADGKHIRLSGTSMAAPQVTGTCALLLERYPTLKPDQLKALVIAGSHGYGSTTSPMPDNAKIVNPFTSINQAAATPWPVANAGATPCNGINATTNTATWGANGYWDQAYWDTAYWDTAYWDVSTTYD